MRIEFKKIAEQNALISQQFLGEFYDASWRLAQISSRVIDRCMNMPEVANDEKRTLLLLMLRNCISDLCCCLDSLERGHSRTVSNNLRMIFEDFSCAVHVFYKDDVYKKFLNGEHSASKSIGVAKKLRPNDTKYQWLYGELSAISHHVSPDLLARQMVSRDGPLSHLKLVDPDRLSIQVNPLLMILDFLWSIGEFSEEMCLQMLATPYFWIKPSMRNLETEEAQLIRKLIQKAVQIIGKRAKV